MGLNRLNKLTNTFIKLWQPTSNNQLKYFLDSFNKAMDHTRALNLRKKLGDVYPFEGPPRVVIPEDKISWDVSWEGYNPPVFNSPRILNKPWADPEIGEKGFQPKWNDVDGKLNRVSWEGDYKTDIKGYPLNPVGRVGIRGRGSLGKWGPNHAADAIVTRWKRNENGEIIIKDNLGVLQFAAITRQDSGELAIPGGMVEPGEDPFEAGKREFLEEVFSLEEMDEKAEHAIKVNTADTLTGNVVVYKGYVDDRRSTDNAWIETFALNYHIEDKDNVFNQLKFKAGSDAKGADWVDISLSLNLYASHGNLIKKVVDLRNAYYGI